MRETSCDVLIVGAGTGGTAAALAATELGMRVILTEETDWIGGQLTAQAIPPDEHPWIEQFGCTARYRKYRDWVRRFYREYTPLSSEAMATNHLNPGGGWVSRLCHEPRVGWMVLNQMLQPALLSHRLDLRLLTTACAVTTHRDHIEAVTIRDNRSGDETTVYAKFVLDGTELGDLLPMASAEYVVGAESVNQTDEPNAVDGGRETDNVQALTWAYAMAYDAGSNRVIDKPEQYDKWKHYKPEFWPAPFFGFEDLNPQTGKPRQLPLFGGKRQPWFKGDFGLFTYRQIVNPSTFRDGAAPHPVTIVNWPQNDYFEASIIDVPVADRDRRLNDARQLSMSLLYWLQTEAPNLDGGVGYPGLYLRPDITGTDDGLAKSPYIRESRRIVAKTTIKEQYVSASCHPGLNQAPQIVDSVGIGSYRIDLHPSTNGTGYIDTSTLPFQIPLGALVPVRLANLLPACKNLGVTHITNGCYRLHPVEWNIGEVAGVLAAHCIEHGFTPQQVHGSAEHTLAVQKELVVQGVELSWPHLNAT